MKRLRREWEDFWVPFSSDPVVRAIAFYTSVLIFAWIVAERLASVAD